MRISWKEYMTAEEFNTLIEWLSSPEYRQEQIDIWRDNMQKAQAMGDEEAVKTCWNKLTHYMYPFKPTRKYLIGNSLATAIKSAD